jgi:uncharacterized protein YbjT (DUF2867 family)
MRVILFGATGMVGRGVLRECLLDDGVEEVLSIGRTALPRETLVPDLSPHLNKLRDLVHADLYHYSEIENELRGYDACFFCLGVTSAGKKEAEYSRITYDLTVAAAATLAGLNPQMTFVYVSGVGTDSTEKGRIMWARVKGRTENALLHMQFKAAYMFRPGIIEAKHGERTKTNAYKYLYNLTAWLIPVIRAFSPNSIVTTEEIGRAMIRVVRDGYAKNILEPADIKKAAK